MWLAVLAQARKPYTIRSSVSGGATRSTAVLWTASSCMVGSGGKSKVRRARWRESGAIRVHPGACLSTWLRLRCPGWARERLLWGVMRNVWQGSWWDGCEDRCSIESVGFLVWRRFTRCVLLVCGGSPRAHEDVGADPQPRPKVLHQAGEAARCGQPDGRYATCRRTMETRLTVP